MERVITREILWYLSAYGIKISLVHPFQKNSKLTKFKIPVKFTKTEFDGDDINNFIIANKILKLLIQYNFKEIHRLDFGIIKKKYIIKIAVK